MAKKTIKGYVGTKRPKGKIKPPKASPPGATPNSEKDEKA